MAKIFLDPGHGAHDPGAVGKNSKEKDNVLKVGKKMAEILRANGHTVKLSRTTDVFVTLSGRAKMANDWGADVFISLHNNAATASAKGFETFIYNGGVSGNTKKLQSAIHSAIADKIGTTNRGKKSANFAVIRLSKMPAVLIEYAFISNADDEKILTGKVNELAQWTAEGIVNYIGGKVSTPKASKPPKSPSKPASKPKSKWVSISGNWTGQTLKKWHHGKPVAQLQKLVSVKADGYFGADTEKAVRAAQKSAGIAADGMAGKDTYRVLNSGGKGKTKANLKVDGKAGKSTIKAIQQATGSKYTDGMFSGQSQNSVTKAFYSGISYGKGGSPSVKLLQKKVGAKQDGLLGAATVRALQKYLGTTIDGVLSRPSSAAIKELQRRLNAGTF